MTDDERYRAEPESSTRISDAEYKVLEPDVKTAARTTAREWDGVIEADDAEQEIWLHLLERPNVMAEIVAMDRPARVLMLTKTGRQIGSQARDDYSYFSGNYSYGTEEVRGMLDRGALESDEATGDFGAVDTALWELPESAILKLNRTDTETATERVDLVLGMKGLRDSQSPYFADIVNRYVLGMPCTDVSARKRVQRAVDALAVEMNRVNTRRRFEHDGLGSRKVVPNTTAHGRTGNEYDG